MVQIMTTGSTQPQVSLFDVTVGARADEAVAINDRCRIRTRAGYQVVDVCGLPLAYYAVGDSLGEAHAMVSLVEQGWAQQNEVARAFDCSDRTVRRNQRRFETGGLAALGRGRGYPKGKPRLPPTRAELVNGWKTEGVANREMARRLGVNEKAVRKQLLRLGWQPEETEQIRLDIGLEGADPKLSGPEVVSSPSPQVESTEGPRVEETPRSAPAAAEAPPGADPKLSGSDAAASAPLPVSFDGDPSDRHFDRVLAYLGLLDDAAPMFRTGTQVSGVGVLLAVPALVDSGVFDIARDVYGSIGPAFYGLRTAVATLLLMALLRIKRPEELKEHSPQNLGRVLGLDRAPEVKTLRRKLSRLAGFGRAAVFGHALAQRRVASHGHAMGFLYVDGHVRAYHGKRSLPKAHLARMRLSMPATTDYWVNDAEGEPLFVVTTEANDGLVKMLPGILDEVRSLVGDRRVTVVFDRGGWSPILFGKLIADGFDILTYRKGRSRRVPRNIFRLREGRFDGKQVRYLLADQGIYLHYGPSKARKRLHLRQVTRLGDDGHQTPIVTSRRDLTAIEVAYRMFERWRQENFFKYLRQEYALDVLVDYDVEPADPTRDVPNPRRKELNAQLRKAYDELSLLAAEYGVEAFANNQSTPRTVRDFKKANTPLTKSIRDALETTQALEKKRAAVPTRVPVQQVTRGEVVKLSVERKHLTDLLKMVAYQAEGDLLRLVSPHYRRAEQEGRTLVQSVIASAGDIDVIDGELLVTLEPLSSPHKTEVLAALCQQLNDTNTRFPGSGLHLRFGVKPEPELCLAFPGPRSLDASLEQ